MIDDTTRGAAASSAAALRLEIERHRVARLGRHRRTPSAEKLAHQPLVLGIALRRRIGDPQIDLECAVALPAELLGPGGDAVGRGQ